MNEFDHFKIFILCSGDVAADVDHLHVKRIHLVDFSYIVIEDALVHDERFFSIIVFQDCYIFIGKQLGLLSPPYTQGPILPYTYAAYGLMIQRLSNKDHDMLLCVVLAER
jgi:hypothetical protein